MVTPDTKSKVKALYKKLKSENFERVSITKCNGYVRQLNYLKDLLYKIGDRGVGDMGEIEEVQSPIFGGDDEDMEEALEETLEEALEQIGLIMTNLGIEEYEGSKENVPNSSGQVFNFTQNQNTTISMNAQINNLYQEFQKELDKSSPNKLKLVEIVKAIVKLFGFIL